MVEVGARAIGARVLRAEDPRILTGRGRYVDDVVLPGHAPRRVPAQHGARTAASCRSTSRLRGRCPGVVAVYTGEDLARFTEAGRGGRGDRHAT